MTTSLWAAGYVATGAALGALSSVALRRLLRTTSPPRWAVAPGSAAVATMALFALLAWRPGLRPELFGYSVLAVVAVPLVVIDVVEQRLPNVLVMPLYPVLLISFVFAAPERMPRATAAMIASATFLFALGVLIAGGVGAGDIKLGGILGLVTGWSGWATTLLAVLLASTATWGYLMVKHTSSGKRAAPFGPGLLGGTFIALVVT